jgi:LPS-assembly lipoprotein
LLSACGFHLRGMIHLPHHLQKIAIIHQTPIHRDMLLALETLLHENHIQTVDTPSAARYWLILESDQIDQTLSNVSASTIPRQYQLTYRIHYAFSKADGTPIVPSRALSVTQQATINNNRILGSNFEARTIERDLEQKAAEQMLYQISLVGGHGPTGPLTPLHP